MKRYFVNVSGGGIRFFSLLVAFMQLVYGGINIVACSGVSAGAIVVWLYFCSSMTKGYDMAKKTYSRRVIFSYFKDPIGKVSGVSFWAIILSLLRIRKNYLGEMDNLEKNMRKIVTKSEWKGILKNNKIDCFIHCVDELTHEAVSFNLKDLDYDQAISVVIGSASIAPVIKAREVVINGRRYLLVDGGHRDSSAGSFLLKNKIVSDFDECVTVWSRGNIEDHKTTKNVDTGNLFKRLINFTIGSSLRESSINDEYQEAKECEALGKKYSPIHVKTNVSDTYSITKKQLKEGEQIAINKVKEYLKR